MQVAIKFYLDRSAFERERELYNEVQLKSVMPATLAAEANTSGTISTPYGYTFPPFVIIECGQSLDEWSRDNENKDFVTVFQVCGTSQNCSYHTHAHAGPRAEVLTYIHPGRVHNRVQCWLSWGTLFHVQLFASLPN